MLRWGAASRVVQRCSSPQPQAAPVVQLILCRQACSGGHSLLPAAADVSQRASRPAVSQTAMGRLWAVSYPPCIQVSRIYDLKGSQRDRYAADDPTAAGGEGSRPLTSAAPLVLPSRLHPSISSHAPQPCFVAACLLASSMAREAHDLVTLAFSPHGRQPGPVSSCRCCCAAACTPAVTSAPKPTKIHVGVSLLGKECKPRPAEPIVAVENWSFAGAVLLDENLKELNLTSPTLVGPQAFARLQRALWSGEAAAARPTRISWAQRAAGAQGHGRSPRGGGGGAPPRMVPTSTAL